MDAQPDRHIRLFWQTGCTSCLRLKEMLTTHKVNFESINVLEDPQGWTKLAALGPKTVPVVAVGDKFMFGQMLGDVAKFVGIEVDLKILPPPVLVAKLDRVLDVALKSIQQVPEAQLRTLLPGRPRSYAGLAFHIFRIPSALLEVCRGETYTAILTDPPMPEKYFTAAALTEFGASIRRDFAAWWAGYADRECQDEVETYYGRKPLLFVLERTTWHAAQHTRQLGMVLEILKVPAADKLSADDLKGLPVPEKVWDGMDA